MKLRRSSIRLRLTLWYAAVLFVIMSIVSLGVYFFMQNRLESMARSKLDSGYSTVENVITISGGDLYDVVHLGQTSLFQLTREGEIIYRTIAWDDAKLVINSEKGAFNPYGSWKSPEGRLYMLKLGFLPDYGFGLAYAQDATELEESLRNLTVILLAAIPGAIILALIGGYFLAGRALSPVSAITKKAREITAERLSERLPVSNPNDEIGRLASVFNDTLARLDSSFEQLRRFTADASHELRTPLTSIRSVGEVAMRSSHNDVSYREAIGSMLEETERLNRLLDSLLTLASGDSGMVHHRPQSLDITFLVGKVVDELRILAEEKAQTVSLSQPSPIMVKVDSATLRQAVTNVLHNAIRYTQAGGHIEVVMTTTDDGKAIIDIMDDGPGIPEAERTKVFERFYRVDKARSRTEGGAGLGLAIARWAAEVNKGSIEFRDKEGPGSCCRITLPLDKTS